MQAQVREIFVAGLEEHFATETEVTVLEIETKKNECPRIDKLMSENWED